MSKLQVSEQDAAQGYALACQLFPRSDLVLDVVGKRFRTAIFEDDMTVATRVPSPTTSEPQKPDSLRSNHGL